MSEQAESAARVGETRGVPLGGMGTGGIELGPDGCFRNVTINNNRWADERIPLAANAFMAVRAKVDDTPSVLLLQRQSGLPWDELETPPQMATAADLHFEALYPAAIYRIGNPAFPLEVRWEMRSLLIPYDSQASSLPLIVATVRFRNSTRHTVEASALWNWENLNGCTASSSPEDRGAIRPRMLPDAPTTEDAPPPQAFGLFFGDAGFPKSNAHGSYYLAGACGAAQRTTVMTWDAHSPGEFEAFWRAFREQGKLGNLIARNPSARMGAVCCKTRVPAGGEVSVRMYFAWHCPRYEVDGTNHGNHYAAFTDNAQEVVGHLLRHEGYFVRGAKGWQESLLRSSLPAWLSRSMINSLSVLTTNTLFGQDQQFARMESPGSPGVGRLDRSFHGSLPLLLLYPELEERELILFAKEGKLSGEPGSIVGQMGCKAFGDGAAARTAPPEMLPMVLLLACRNAMMTGRRVPLEILWPLLRRMLEESGAFSKSPADLDDTAREGRSSMAPWTSDRATAWLSSLWVTGLHAAAVLARHLGHPKDAEALEVRLGEWLTLFDEELWDEAAGHYRLHTGESDTAPVCHEGQLAGQWYAEFLNFGRLFDLERVARSLAAIRRNNERPDGVRQAAIDPGLPWPYSKRFPVPGLTWPAHALTQYVCPLICAGEAEHALKVARRILEGMQHQGASGWPLRYDLDLQRPVGPESDHHVSAPAVWHVYAALTGFFMDALRQTIWLRPRLPEGVAGLSVPIFSPICMGWLKWREDREGSYRQSIELTFDSPVVCTTMLIRVPDDAPALKAECESGLGMRTVSVQATSDGRDKLLRIAMPGTMTTTEWIKVNIRKA